MNLEVISILVISSAPATVILYNLLSMAGYLTPEDAYQLNESWKEGLRERELSSDDYAFDKVLSIISE